MGWIPENIVGLWAGGVSGLELIDLVADRLEAVGKAREMPPRDLVEEPPWRQNMEVISIKSRMGGREPIEAKARECEPCLDIPCLKAKTHSQVT